VVPSAARKLSIPLARGKPEAEHIAEEGRRSLSEDHNCLALWASLGQQRQNAAVQRYEPPFFVGLRGLTGRRRTPADVPLDGRRRFLGLAEEESHPARSGETDGSSWPSAKPGRQPE